MRTLNCKLFLPIILSLCFLLGTSSAANSAGPQSVVLARWDIYEIIFGTFLSVIGLALIVLSLLRRKADALIRELFNWSGKPSEEALDDDLTLIVADYQHV